MYGKIIYMDTGKREKEKNRNAEEKISVFQRGKEKVRLLRDDRIVGETVWRNSRRAFVNTAEGNAQGQECSGICPHAVRGRSTGKRKG